mmetsp:Transcript_125504/g.217631  ORF Transcript_125504/g.217631 Transcript_125504/m.217631 type:complete len:121 (-) Transcript_125504:101-463(-)
MTLTHPKGPPTVCGAAQRGQTNEAGFRSEGGGLGAATTPRSASQRADAQRGPRLDPPPPCSSTLLFTLTPQGAGMRWTGSTHHIRTVGSLFHLSTDGDAHPAARSGGRVQSAEGVRTVFI